MGAQKAVFVWNAATSWLAGTVVAALLGLFAWWQLIPLDVSMIPAAGSTGVDPRHAVTLQTVGLGSRIAQIAVRDSSGRLVAGAEQSAHFRIAPPLAFGTRYTVNVQVVRDWTGQTAGRVLSFETAAMPQLQGTTTRLLGADGSVALQFDRPVGGLQLESDQLDLTVQGEASQRRFRVVAKNYRQGQSYPVQLNWTTSAGIPLPPLTLQLVAPPPLTAKLDAQGLSDVGLALPLLFTFSEPLLDREAASAHIAVQVKDGEAVAGRWQWLGKRRLQFTPRPAWPAASTIAVHIDPAGLVALGGGHLERALDYHFSTGSDRRIVVYLDTQKVEAIEAGEVVRTFSVSTGKAGTPTVSGTYYIYARYPIKTMRSSARPGQPGYYVVENVPYAQYFHEGYAFHGAWWHNAFGTPVSHGCVNMSTRNHNRRWPNAREDAGWLWRWAALGVPVTVYRHTPARAAT
ncbi:L,D-transpeptidase family protein [Gloeobacter kilaueensis]|uniref:ErfK/YbiS/YcfS/YnhG family protein n=1 Tax=Gloeobacter kilaueensis (strain ATCC BAA-2537 / CCAP 1431/1 / ULC 316 / JS1) TaxID=1183438 RepID=U5QI29_GLOK1|nr:L,D-transpeptidase family protein [Gloeobacter kilaueensis]AGY58586.1 ErfK/YbiS/YcfS/YnhG family protein [Gloeobacter kilaueensis JS1]